MHLGIIAATFTGNRGAEAMLLSTIDHVRARFPRSVVHVLSYSPAADLAEFESRPIKNVFIHPATPLTLVAKWLPLAIVAKALPLLKHTVCPHSHAQGVLSLLRLDALFCLAGVSFIDGRGKFLLFNVLTLFPFLIHGVPVFKMAQAMGPIRSLPNRLCARWTLPRVRFIFARGRSTARFLDETRLLDPSRWDVSPDIAFGLKCDPPAARAGDLALVPSVILDRRHANYRKFIVDLVSLLAKDGVVTDLVVHSWKNDTGNPFNNDLPLAMDLRESLREQGVDVRILGEGCNAREIKSQISARRICLTSRFHGMVAALDSAMPTVVLGWSHKYREVLAVFDRESWALNIRENTPTSCAGAVKDLLAREQEERSHLATRLPAVREAVTSAFDRVFGMILK